MLKKIIVWLLFFWNGLIAFLSLINLNELPTIEVNHLDKLYHFIFYFVLSVLWLIYLFFRQNIKFQKAVIISFSLSFVLGVGLEFLQDLTPYRSFDWLDVVFNTLGIICGIVFVCFKRDYLNKILSY